MENMKNKIRIATSFIIGIVLTIGVLGVATYLFDEGNDDVIRMSFGDGHNTVYYVLNSNGVIQVEAGICRNNELTFDLNKKMKFDKATKLGIQYQYAEYMPYPAEEIIPEFVELAENVFSYATNDFNEVFDVAPVTLWYDGKQIRRSNHQDLPTDMKKILDRFEALSPIR